MSKNRNYQSYYKQPETEQPIEDAVTEELPEPKEEPTFETDVTPTEVIQKATAIVKGAPKVNMRSAPNKDATVIAVLPENTEVLIESDSNEYWYQIEFNGASGYMMSKYLKRI